MTTVVIAKFIELDQESLVSTLEEAGKNLESAEGETVVDFSSVERLDSAAVTAVAEFAETADHKGVKVVLRSVNVGVYKVLKLVKLTSRFSFAG
jgi:ABC-type transporter Mla MlaB component